MAITVATKMIPETLRTPMVCNNNRHNNDKKLRRVPLYRGQQLWLPQQAALKVVYSDFYPVPIKKIETVYVQATSQHGETNRYQTKLKPYGNTNTPHMNQEHKQAHAKKKHIQKFLFHGLFLFLCLCLCLLLFLRLLMDMTKYKQQQTQSKILFLFTSSIV
mmetsp:Transcript_33194/g.55570  ORF Transcript_33194/g.55570 Transcript_33194/m.55570 type:complete len:161 (+) Transcript_33194:1522-2004(+)